MLWFNLNFKINQKSFDAKTPLWTQFIFYWTSPLYSSLDFDFYLPWNCPFCLFLTSWQLGPFQSSFHGQFLHACYRPSIILICKLKSSEISYHHHFFNFEYRFFIDFSNFFEFINLQKRWIILQNLEAQSDFRIHLSYLKTIRLILCLNYLEIILNSTFLYSQICLNFQYSHPLCLIFHYLFWKKSSYFLETLQI